MNKKALSVVIPVYNSEFTILEVVERINETAKNSERIEIKEVILVNDCSRDNSLDKLKEISKTYSFVKVLNLAKNSGQHKALITGMREISGDYLLCLDDDLQTIPEEFPKLLNELESKDYDVVFGMYDEIKQTGFRKFGSSVNGYMTEKLLDKPKELKLTSYFICKKFVYEEMIKYTQPYPYVSGLLLKITKNIGNVKVEHAKREYGESNYSFKKLISLWFNGFSNFSTKPFRVISVGGVLISCISFLWIIWIIVNKVLGNTIEMGWSSLMVTVIFFGGLNIFVLGFIGEYIGRIFMCLNQTSQCVVRDRYLNGEKIE